MVTRAIARHREIGSNVDKAEITKLLDSRAAICKILC
jgi:hypothetical protein